MRGRRRHHPKKRDEHRIQRRNKETYSRGPRKPGRRRYRLS